MLRYELDKIVRSKQAKARVKKSKKEDIITRDAQKIWKKVKKLFERYASANRSTSISIGYVCDSLLTDYGCLYYDVDVKCKLSYQRCFFFKLKYPSDTMEVIMEISKREVGDVRSYHEDIVYFFDYLPLSVVKITYYPPR